MIKDPVCWMEVDETKPQALTLYKGRTYFFCSRSCKEHFERKPEQYVKTS